MVCARFSCAVFYEGKKLDGVWNMYNDTVKILGICPTNYVCLKERLKDGKKEITIRKCNTKVFSIETRSIRCMSDR